MGIGAGLQAVDCWKWEWWSRESSIISFTAQVQITGREPLRLSKQASKQASHQAHPSSFPRSSSHLDLVLVIPPRHRTRISPHAKASQQAESNGQALLRLDRARDAAASQHDAGQQRELDAVGLLLRDAVGAQRVEGADGAAGGHGGDAAGAKVADGAAAGGEGGEDVADLGEGLGGGGQLALLWGGWWWRGEGGPWLWF